MRTRASRSSGSRAASSAAPDFDASRRRPSSTPTCSRAASGASTDIVQKEMYTFDDGGGRSVTLRPEGTAPICRAYAEHGMHKLPQPVKLWYLSSFFRQEKPQAGRFRQFWQIGAEAIGSDDPAVDAEVIVLLGHAARRARGRRPAAADREPRDARGAPRLSRRAAGPPAGERRPALRRRARPDRAQPVACV